MTVYIPARAARIVHRLNPLAVFILRRMICWTGQPENLNSVRPHLWRCTRTGCLYTFDSAGEMTAVPKKWRLR